MKKTNKKSKGCSSYKKQNIDLSGIKELVCELQIILRNAEIMQEQIMQVDVYYGIPGASQNYGDKFCGDLLDNILRIIGLIEDEIELRIQEILNSK